MNTLTDIFGNPSKLEIFPTKSFQDHFSSQQLEKTTTPKVSVIIPVYNSAKYIQTALESVFNQTYTNYEIIVIDDGSTDDTREQLKPYQDKIRYFYQENQGSAAARNLGIKLAKGELIAFLDADDYWLLSEKLEKQVSCFQENPSLGCINTGWRIVDDEGKHIQTVQPWHKAPKLDLETWLKKKCVRTSAMVFRREWLEKVGGFDEELRQSHDVDLILRLSLAGCETDWLKEETVCYRQHEENTTKNSLKQAKYVQAVLDKFFSRDDLPESISQQESEIRYHTLVWIAWYQYRAGNLDEMANFLQKSLDFSPYLRVENISHWLTTFKRFSEERGEDFNIDFVTDSGQWRKLVGFTLGLPILELETQIQKPNKTSQTIKETVQVSPSKNTQFSLETKIQEQAIATEIISEIQQHGANESIFESNSTKVSKVKNKIVSNFFQSAVDYVNLADSKAEQQKLDEAANLYQKAIALEPNAWKIHRKLAKVLRQQGNLDLAVSEFQQTIKLQPEIGEVYTDLGETFAQLGKWNEAIANYTKGIKLSPKQPWSYYKLANLLEKQHQFEDAVANLNKAIEYNQNNPLFYRNLAQIQQILGNLEESIAAYRQAIKLNPDFELTVYRNLGQAIQNNNSVKARMGLGNLVEKLNNRVCKIAYLGAAPTAQQDGYMWLLHQELVNYFHQPHVAIQAANGGITSNAAVFTMDKEVIPHQPNLCFIEYSSADMGKGYSVSRAVEGMVKKLIAINCRICFLYLYKQGNKFDSSDPVLAEYEKVAEFYSIPSINAGKYLENSLRQGQFVPQNLFKGKDKTLPEGANVVATFIFNGLKEIFTTSRKNNLSSFNYHTNKARYIDPDNYGQAEIVKVDISMMVDQENYKVGKFKQHQYYQIDSSNEIRFTIKGELVGITTIIGRDAGIISLKASGYEREYKLWDSYCYEDRFQSLIIQRYFAKPTLVRLKLTDKPVDYSKCIRKIENYDLMVKNLKIVALLVCGHVDNSVNSNYSKSF